MSGIHLTCFTSSWILENHQWELLGQVGLRRTSQVETCLKKQWLLCSDKCYTTTKWMLSVRELGDTEGALERVLYPLKVTPVRKESHWISRTGNQQRTGWIFPANITAQILSLSGVFIWYSWNPYWTYYLLWGFGNCLLHRKLWIREEKKPTLNVGVGTVCHLRTRSLTSGRCSTCIFKCLNERKICFHLLAKMPKIKKSYWGSYKVKV